MDQDFAGRITYIAQIAKSSGYEDVSAWMQRMLAATIREERPKRKRGTEVTLPKINRKVRLDADRVKELMRNGE